MISKGFYEELVNIANEKHLELEDVFNVVILWEPSLRHHTWIIFTLFHFRYISEFPLWFSGNKSD